MLTKMITLNLHQLLCWYRLEMSNGYGTGENWDEDTDASDCHQYFLCSAHCSTPSCPRNSLIPLLPALFCPHSILTSIGKSIEPLAFGWYHHTVLGSGFCEQTLRMPVTTCAVHMMFSDQRDYLIKTQKKEGVTIERFHELEWTGSGVRRQRNWCCYLMAFVVLAMFPVQNTAKN